MKNNKFYKKQNKHKKKTSIKKSFLLLILILIAGVGIYCYFATHLSNNIKNLLISAVKMRYIVLLMVLILFICFIRWLSKKMYSRTMQQIDTMDGQNFEIVLKHYFEKLGYKVSTTPTSNDYGADLVMKKHGKITIVQAKRYKHSVGNSAVQEIVAAKAYYKADKCMVVINSYFTKNARFLANANNVELWDRDQLMQLIYYTDGQWNDLLENIKIEFSESDIKENGFFDKNTVAVESENPVIEEFNSNPQQKVTNGNWRCSKCGLEVIADYNYCPFCKYVEKSDYKNEANK